jgi:asparagine synthase (glutamine-hydrolysing)
MWMVGDILLKADRMSMANSLELRVPFLDKEVFKVAASLPTELRVNKLNTKYAMRKAAARHLPLEVAEKEKLGFPVPTRVWLKDEHYYNVVKDMFLSPTAEKFFNTDVLLEYLDEHFEEKEDNSRKIWTIYVFLVWYQIYFGAVVPEEPDNALSESTENAAESAFEEPQADQGEDAEEASDDDAEQAEAPADDTPGGTKVFVPVKDSDIPPAPVEEAVPVEEEADIEEEEIAPQMEEIFSASTTRSHRAARVHIEETEEAESEEKIVTRGESGSPDFFESLKEMLREDIPEPDAEQIKAIEEE